MSSEQSAANAWEARYGDPQTFVYGTKPNDFLFEAVSGHPRGIHPLTRLVAGPAVRRCRN
jgi:hypothetical protein